MLSRFLKHAFASVMVLFASLLPLRGQVTTASYYCIVTDNSGAVIPGATVTITNDRTGAVASRATDQQGEVGFTFLIVGAYRLRIEAQGFKGYQAEGIELTAGQQVRRTFVMELGAITETVNVQAAAPLVNAVSAEQNQTSKVSRSPNCRWRAATSRTFSASAPACRDRPRNTAPCA